MHPVCRGHSQSIIPCQQCTIVLFLLFADSWVTSVKEYLPKMLKFVIEDGAFRKSNLCTSSLRILYSVKRVLVMYCSHAQHACELEGQKLEVAVAVVPIAHELKCASLYCWMLLVSCVWRHRVLLFSWVYRIVQCILLRKFFIPLVCFHIQNVLHVQAVFLSQNCTSWSGWDRCCAVTSTDQFLSILQCSFLLGQMLKSHSVSLIVASTAGFVCFICINAQRLFLPLFQHTAVTRFSSVPIRYAVCSQPFWYPYKVSLIPWTTCQN